MHALVVYESIFGNTRTIAEAIASGLGPDVPCLSTAEATPARLEGVDLLVAGAPMQAFSLPGERIRESIDPDTDPKPDLSAPTLRSWLEALPTGHGRAAAFDTKISWSPGSAAGVIQRELAALGYEPIAEPQHFVVGSKYGPLRFGEVERAKAWGKRLASLQA